MNVKDATLQIANLIHNTNLPEIHPEYGKDHLFYMVKEIVTDRVTGEKAHRWLGWLQACICIGDAATLEELKELNATK